VTNLFSLSWNLLLKSAWFRKLSKLPDLSSALIANNPNIINENGLVSNNRGVIVNNKRIDHGTIRKSMTFHSLKNKNK